MSKCIVCGKPVEQAIDLPAGKLFFCGNTNCLDTLNLKINNAIPVAQFCMADLLDHEVIDEEILKKYEDDVEVVARLAVDVEEYVWGGETLGEMFADALAEAGKGT